MSEMPTKALPDKKRYRLRSLARLLFFGPFDRVAALLPINQNKSDRTRVVFARLDSVGDFVIWTAALPIFEKAFPSDKFEKILIANSGWAKMAEMAGFFDRVISLQRKRFVTSPSYRFNVIRDIRSLGADIFINPTQSRDLLWVDSLVRISGASQTFAAVGVNNRMSERQNRKTNLWYSNLIDASSQDDHEIVNNHRFACEIANESKESPLNLSNLSFVRRNDNKSPAAMLFLGANAPYRRWPAENFASAAKYIAEKYNLEIILGRGPGEEDLAAQFMATYTGKVTHLTGKTTLTEMAEIMSSVQMLLSNDTGPAHMAAAVGCPAVVVMSGAELGRFFPYPQELADLGLRQFCATYDMHCFGCAWNCIYNDLPERVTRPCITNISVESVIKKIDLCLGK